MSLHSKSLPTLSASLCLHGLRCRLTSCLPETSMEGTTDFKTCTWGPCNVFLYPALTCSPSTHAFTAPVWDCLEPKSQVWGRTSGRGFQTQVHCSTYHLHPSHQLLNPGTGVMGSQTSDSIHLRDYQSQSSSSTCSHPTHPFLCTSLRLLGDWT